MSSSKYISIIYTFGMRDFNATRTRDFYFWYRAFDKKLSLLISV